MKEYKTVIHGREFAVMDFTQDSYPTAGTKWTMLHPRMTIEALGFLPSMLHEKDERSAREQFNANYQFGGWNSFGGGQWRLGHNNTLHYPGDPPMSPLAMTRLRDEVICFYPSSFVAIIQPDRSFDVA